MPGRSFGRPPAVDLDHRATGKEMQTDTETNIDLNIDLINALTDEQTRTFSARIDGVEIYRSQYNSIGIKVLSESPIDPRGHQRLTFHINDNPLPVYSLSLEVGGIDVSEPTFPTADFF